MTPEEREIVQYRLGRAFEALEEAALLLEGRHVNSHVSRLYYACYYAVSALLLARGLTASKHGQARALLHKEFVKKGALPKELGRVYDRLFDGRQKGDYADFVRYAPEDVAGWMAEAREFVARVSELAQGSDAH